MKLELQKPPQMPARSARSPSSREFPVSYAHDSFTRTASTTTPCRVSGKVDGNGLELEDLGFMHHVQCSTVDSRRWTDSSPWDHTKDPLQITFLTRIFWREPTHSMTHSTIRRASWRSTRHSPPPFTSQQPRGRLVAVHFTNAGSSDDTGDFFGETWFCWMGIGRCAHSQRCSAHRGVRIVVLRTAGCFLPIERLNDQIRSATDVSGQRFRN